MENSRTWGEFYSKPAGMFFFIRDIIVHLRYLFAIVLKRPSRILEIGTGTGIQSIFLSHFIKNVIALDSDRKVVMNTKINIKHSRVEMELILADAFSMPFKDRALDVCYSQGFLEHFADKEIIRLIREEFRVSKSLAHSVPSDHYPWRQFGDERRLAPRTWLNLVSESMSGNPNMTAKVKYGYLPLINWYIIIEAKLKTAKLEDNISKSCKNGTCG